MSQKKNACSAEKRFSIEGVCSRGATSVTFCACRGHQSSCHEPRATSTVRTSSFSEERQMTPIYPGPIGTDGFGGFQTLSAELPLGHSGSNSSRSFFSDDFLTNDRMEYPLADASRTLFLGDLSYFCTEEDLCAVFAGYGPILTVRVRRGVTGESLMHGFIALDTPEAARQAILDLDGIEFMGRNMRYLHCCSFAAPLLTSLQGSTELRWSASGSRSKGAVCASARELH